MNKSIHIGELNNDEDMNSSTLSLEVVSKYCPNKSNKKLRMSRWVYIFVNNIQKRIFKKETKTKKKISPLPPLRITALKIHIPSLIVFFFNIFKV